MLGHGLAGTESARYRSGSAFCKRKENIQNTLAGNQRPGNRLTQGMRSGAADRPLLHQLDLFDFAGRRFDFGNDVFAGISAGRYNLFNDALHIGRYHNLVGNQRRLRRGCQNGAGAYGFTNGKQNRDIPFFVHIHGVRAQPAGNKRAGKRLNAAQRTFNAVKNVSDQAGPQCYSHRRPGRGDRLTDGQAGGLLIDLNYGVIAVYGNDLADQALISYIDHLLHREGGGVFYGYDRTVDTINYCCFIHFSIPPLFHNQTAVFIKQIFLFINSGGKRAVDHLHTGRVF